jgi:hypothetical protein
MRRQQRKLSRDHDKGAGCIEVVSGWYPAPLGASVPDDGVAVFRVSFSRKEIQ